MEGIKSVDLMVMVLSTEKNKLNSAIDNLSRVNESFTSKLDAKGKAVVVNQNFPTINEVLFGAPGEINSSVLYNKAAVKESIDIVNGSLVSRYQPDIVMHEEMLALNDATRGYEAAIKMFNLYKEMSGKSLTIGKS
ncbi:hypothetical protein K6Y31_20280 [Motilimonas cestriensis]|uniref:Uncharacterized protein n=1 Tax=Motilimonas cestriensis TaxID=2742685 RepID=A0ABS8WF50_9GAMM|nr:hypothetical protein [Motilimonas cestriensis]MCE2597115.1 hypothetical protein [Motilimonas cestriensis]